MNPIRRRRLGGKTYPMVAAHFTAASSQYQTIASNSSLQVGTTDFSIAAWVYLDSKGANRILFSKGAVVSAANCEYLFWYSNGSDRFLFTMSNGAAFTSATDAVLGSPAIGTWYHLIGVFDATAHTQTIYINNGSGTQVTNNAGSNNGANAFQVGAGNATNFHDGRIDTPALWKRALSASDRTALYNGGTGLASLDLTAGLQSSLSFWSDEDGSGADASGSGNNLTDVNGVTYVTGKR